MASFDPEIITLADGTADDWLKLKLKPHDEDIPTVFVLRPPKRFGQVYILIGDITT